MSPSVSSRSRSSRCSCRRSRPAAAAARTRPPSAAGATTRPPRRRRVAPLTGLPDPSGRRVEALRGHGEDRQHAGRAPEVRRSTRPTSCTKRSSKAASRASRRSSTRTIPTASVRSARCARPTRASCGRSAASSPTPAARRTRSTSINTAPVVRLDETRAGPLMFRDHPAPARRCNLYAHVNFMYSKCGPAGPAAGRCSPTAARRPWSPVHPSASVRVGFLGSPSFAVTWTWDAASGTWKRSIFGEPRGRRIGRAARAEERRRDVRAVRRR